MRALALAAFLVAAFPVSAEAPALRGDLRKLQGTWTLSSVEVDGRRLSGDEMKGARLTIDGTSWRWEGDDPASGTLELTPGTRPRRLDLTRVQDGSAGRTAPCIYRLEGDTLVICREPRGREAYVRPTRFSGERGSGTALFTWVRAR